MEFSFVLEKDKELVDTLVDFRDFAEDPRVEFSCGMEKGGDTDVMDVAEDPGVEFSYGVKVDEDFFDTLVDVTNFAEDPGVEFSRGVEKEGDIDVAADPGAQFSCGVKVDEEAEQPCATEDATSKIKRVYAIIAK